MYFGENIQNNDDIALQKQNDGKIGVGGKLDG